MNGRPRIPIEQFQSMPSIVDAYDKSGSENVMMINMSLLDEYGDMRLDVDNMSYEELLTLGERIGNVSTGLSEDMISKCLTETKNTSDQNHGEETYCICLEEYANEEEIGTLKKCGHNYHVNCIREWLLMKNTCLICKVPPLIDYSK